MIALTERITMDHDQNEFSGNSSSASGIGVSGYLGYRIGSRSALTGPRGGASKSDDMMVDMSANKY